jgi:hypothetical protein
MSIRDDFFAAKAKGSLWDVAVSIKRGNPLPLDADSIFDSYTALETYAADVLAYPGQVVAVVNADSTGIYYLDQNLDIQPVGIIPTGDGKSIEVTANGVISILGASNADSLTLPRMKEDKSGIEWVPVSAIVQGDGNDNTTYDFELNEAGTGFNVTTKFNGVAVEGGVFEFNPEVYTKGEVDELVEGIEEMLGDLGDKTVVELINAEKLRAEGVETDLLGKINAIDFVDEDELAAALAPITESLGTKAAQTDLEALKGRVEAFLDNTGAATEAIDTLQELITYINEHDDVEISDIIADV